jgi:formyl-CoA transferase
LEDPRFATREARGQHEAEIDRMISDWIHQHNKHDAMRLIGAAGVSLSAGAVLEGNRRSHSRYDRYTRTKY